MVKSICSSDTESVQSVLAHRASSEVNFPANRRDGRTPLHLAASLGNLAITQLLLWANADVNAVDFDGRTCLFYARSSGSQEVVNLLLANGCPRYSKIATPETIV